MASELEDVFSFANVLLDDCDSEQVKDDLNAEEILPAEWVELEAENVLVEGEEDISDDTEEERSLPLTIVSLDPTSFADAKAQEMMRKNERRMEHVLRTQKKKKKMKQIIVQTQRTKDPPTSVKKRVEEKIVKKLAKQPTVKKKTSGSKGTHQLQYTEFKCFECNCSCVDEDGLVSHWKSKHFVPDANGTAVQCAQCDCKYALTAQRFRRFTDVQSCISFYFNHRVKKHAFQVPPFVKSFQCDFPHCTFVAYSVYLIKRHTESGRHCVRQFKGPDNNKPILDHLAQYGSGNKYSLIFKQFKCFVCGGQTEYGSREALWRHWREKHVKGRKGEGVIACASCDVTYRIPQPRLTRLTHIMTCMAYYFSHCVKKHNLEVPPYIVPLRCSHQGCSYVTYTKQLLQRHLQEVKHVAMKKEAPILFTEYCCFLCAGEDGEDLGPFEDVRSYAEHWRSLHFTKGSHQRIISCSDCAETFSVPFNVNDLEVVSIVSRLCSHRIETHAMQPAPYINAISYRSTMPLHKTNSAERKNRVDFNEEKSVSTTTSAPMSLLTFLQLKCFECNDNVVHANPEAYTDHWRQSHFTVADGQACVQCKHCEYSIGLNVNLLHKNHDIGRCIASYLTHCVHKHSSVCPDYIQQLECPEEGCKFRALTMKLMQSHVRHTSHHKLKRCLQKKIDPYCELSLKEMRCFLCDDGVVFDNKDEYDAHLLTVHSVEQDDKPVLFCRHCDASFPSTLSSAITALFGHMVNRHSFPVPWYIEEFKCDETGCDFVAYSSLALQKHLKAQKHTYSAPNLFQSYLNFHEYRCFLCADSSELYENKKVFEQHLNSEHVMCLDEPSLVCPQCRHIFKLHLSNGADYGKTLSIKKYDPSRSLCILLNHMATKHDYAIPSFVLSFKCDHPGCAFTTVRKCTFDRHVKSHVIDKQCYQCGLFFSETRIDKHAEKCGSLPDESTASSDAFTCFQCGISFPRKVFLNKHMLDAHSVQQTPAHKKNANVVFQCEICSKVLTERRSMKRHMLNVHPAATEKFNKIILNQEEPDEPPKLYECTLCSSQISLVKQHFAQHHAMQYEEHHSHLVREVPLPVFECEIVDYVSSTPFDPSLMDEGSAERLAFPSAGGAPDSISDVLDCSMRLSGLTPGDMSHMMPPNFGSDAAMKSVAGSAVPSPVMSFAVSRVAPQEEDEMAVSNPWVHFNKT